MEDREGGTKDRHRSERERGNLGRGRGGGEESRRKGRGGGRSHLTFNSPQSLKFPRRRGIESTRYFKTPWHSTLSSQWTRGSVITSGGHGGQSVEVSHAPFTRSKVTGLNLLRGIRWNRQRCPLDPY